MSQLVKNTMKSRVQAEQEIFHEALGEKDRTDGFRRMRLGVFVRLTFSYLLQGPRQGSIRRQVSKTVEDRYDDRQRSDVPTEIGD